MEPYKFREIKCPSCKHKFAWLEKPFGNSYNVYRRKGIDEELFSTICPNCSLEMVIPKDMIIGIDINDSEIELYGTMRGI